MKETIFSVGRPLPLNGVLTYPNGGASTGRALIILNSGLLHHVGSCLLSVRLARLAAANGWLVLRADVSGIGDSPARRTELDHEKQAIADTLELAAALKEQHGISDLVLSGLCSGAYAAFEACLDDASIKGVAAIAPFTYRTRRWYLKHYRRRLLSSDLANRIVNRLSSRRHSGSRPYNPEFIDATSDIGWERPDQEVMERKYRTMLERGVRFLHTFTGGELGSYNYSGQFREMFPTLDFGDHLEEVFIPEARHIITEPAFQSLVLQRTADWLSRNWERNADAQHGR